MKLYKVLLVLNLLLVGALAKSQGSVTVKPVETQPAEGESTPGSEPEDIVVVDPIPPCEIPTSSTGTAEAKSGSTTSASSSDSSTGEPGVAIAIGLPCKGDSCPEPIPGEDLTEPPGSFYAPNPCNTEQDPPTATKPPKGTQVDPVDPDSGTTSITDTDGDGIGDVITTTPGSTDPSNDTELTGSAVPGYDPTIEANGGMTEPGFAGTDDGNTTTTNSTMPIDGGKEVVVVDDGDNFKNGAVMPISALVGNMSDNSSMESGNASAPSSSAVSVRGTTTRFVSSAVVVVAIMSVTMTMVAI